MKKAAFVFFVANAVPFLAAYYLFKSSVKERERHKKTFAESFMQSDVSLASAKAQELCATAPTVLLLSDSPSVTQVRPQPPETQSLVLPRKFPINAYSYDPLVDVLTAERQDDVIPLDFVHLGLSRDFDQLSQSSATLVYLHPEATVTVRGTLQIVEDERLRDFYWRRSWGSPSDGVLVKLQPTQVCVQETACSGRGRRDMRRPGGPRSAWQEAGLPPPAAGGRSSV